MDQLEVEVGAQLSALHRPLEDLAQRCPPGAHEVLVEDRVQLRIPGRLGQQARQEHRGLRRLSRSQHGPRQRLPVAEQGARVGRRDALVEVAHDVRDQLLLGAEAPVQRRLADARARDDGLHASGRGSRPP